MPADFYADRAYDDMGEILCAVDDHARPSAIFRMTKPPAFDFGHAALDIVRAGAGRHARHEDAAHMLADETSTFLATDEHAN